MEQDQTGRRVLNAYEQLDDHFLAMYGDNYWPIKLQNMLFNYQNAGTEISTTVFSNKNGKGEYGYENNIVVGNDGLVIKYDKMRETREANGVDIGFFIVSKKSLDYNLSDNLSFEEDMLPSYISNNQLAAYITDKQYYYITNLYKLKDFENVVVTNNLLPLPQNYFGV